MALQGYRRRVSNCNASHPGWSGETSETTDETRNAILKQWADKHRYCAVDLDQETAEGFYEGIVNQALWPLFHHFPSLLRFEAVQP